MTLVKFWIKKLEKSHCCVGRFGRIQGSYDITDLVLGFWTQPLNVWHKKMHHCTSTIATLVIYWFFTCMISVHVFKDLLDSSPHFFSMISLRHTGMYFQGPNPKETILQQRPKIQRQTPPSSVLASKIHHASQGSFPGNQTIDTSHMHGPYTQIAWCRTTYVSHSNIMLSFCLYGAPRCQTTITNLYMS